MSHWSKITCPLCQKSLGVSKQAVLLSSISASPDPLVRPQSPAPRSSQDVQLPALLSMAVHLPALPASQGRPQGPAVCRTANAEMAPEPAGKLLGMTVPVGPPYPHASVLSALWNSSCQLSVPVPLPPPLLDFAKALLSLSLLAVWSTKTRGESNTRSQQMLVLQRYLTVRREDNPQKPQRRKRSLLWGLTYWNNSASYQPLRTGLLASISGQEKETDNYSLPWNWAETPNQRWCKRTEQWQAEMLTQEGHGWRKVFPAKPLRQQVQSSMHRDSPVSEDRMGKSKGTAAEAQQEEK